MQFFEVEERERVLLDVKHISREIYVPTGARSCFAPSGPLLVKGQ